MSNELDLRIRRAMQRVVDESPQPPRLPDSLPTIPMTRPRIPGWVTAAAAAAVVLILFGGTALLLSTDNGVGREVVAPVTTILTAPTITPTAPASGTGGGQTASITVSGLTGHPGQHLAGVLYGGDNLTDLDRDALGGFWTIIPDNDAPTTEVIREPANEADGLFPFVSNTALTLDPGMYTLVIWVDFGLSPVTRWVPINTDGMGLFGCQTIVEIGNDTQTDITITPHLQPDGWNTNCTTQ